MYLVLPSYGRVVEEKKKCHRPDELELLAKPLKDGVWGLAFSTDIIFSSSAIRNSPLHSVT